MAIPNVYFIGSSKCATTSIHHIFSAYCDQVCCGVDKENRYFMRDYWRGDKYLNSLYPHSNKVVMDFQPSNCLYPFVAERIKETCPTAKVILIVREPIARAYSHIQHFRKMRPGRLIGSPDSIILDNLKTYQVNKFPDEYAYARQADPAGGNYEATYLEMGNYVEHLWRFRKFNPKVVLFDDFVDHPAKFISSICDYIGVDKFTFDAPHLNSKSGSGNFSPNIVHKLMKHFESSIDTLSKTININLEERWYGK